MESAVPGAGLWLKLCFLHFPQGSPWQNDFLLTLSFVICKMDVVTSTS